jgi:adenine deaminase
VAAQLRHLERWAEELGCSIPSPFMALSFLSLTVIPRLKITVQGLLDVEQGRIVPALLG